jgi:hypothetical protein
MKKNYSFSENYATVSPTKYVDKKWNLALVKLEERCPQNLFLTAVATVAA